MWEQFGKGVVLIVVVCGISAVLRWEIKREVRIQVEEKSIQIENTFKEWTGIWKRIAVELEKRKMENKTP